MCLKIWSSTESSCATSGWRNWIEGDFRYYRYFRSVGLLFAILKLTRWCTNATQSIAFIFPVKWIFNLVQNIVQIRLHMFQYYHISGDLLRYLEYLFISRRSSVILVTIYLIESQISNLHCNRRILQASSPMILHESVLLPILSSGVMALQSCEITENSVIRSTLCARLSAVDLHEKYPCTPKNAHV